MGFGPIGAPPKTSLGVVRVPDMVAGIGVETSLVGAAFYRCVVPIINHGALLTNSKPT